MTVLSDQAIAHRIAQIQPTIPPEVRLIAVSKQVPTVAMRAAYAAGLRDFGESRIQEALTKKAELQDLPDITWHMIGHLQGNKAAKALEVFDWIHSVDSLKLAQRLNELAIHRPTPPQVCLQVKFLPDPTKYGWEAEELQADLAALDQLTHLNIVGLMTIPPFGLPRAETQSAFDQARNMAIAIRQQGYQNIRMEQLSLGMSGDYEMAIAAGSTMVRLGRTLFGERS